MDKGAHFYRCDFQVHTPRDHQWEGKRYISEEERIEYSNRFIKTCREKGLHAVAITDHHDTVFFKYIKQAAKSELSDNGEPIPESERIVVFPGMEVTISIPPAQVLIIFDPDLEEDIYQNVPIVLGIKPSPEHEATGCEVEAINLSAEGIYKQLTRYPGLANRFIILPNVKPNGHKTFMRSGFHTHFKNLPCVGGYLEGISYNDLNPGTKNILEGRNANWTTRPYGVFQTSDCRKDDLSTLGEYSTWVKWAKPSAEALRQACLSRTNRISQTAPELPKIYIESVTVSNSKFLGPIDLYLNPQFTALIGGRGTGKSSFLEFLKWGLCDPSFDKQDNGDIPSIDSKRNELIETMLKSVGAVVTVNWIVNGVRHSIKRDSSTNTIELTIGLHSARQVTVEEIRSLIGIHAYSQKELSTVGVKIDELRRFVETPIIFQLKELSNKIEALSAEIRENFLKYRDYKRILSTLIAEKTALASLTQQAVQIREKLKDLPEESKVTINVHPLFEKEATYIKSIKDKLEIVQQNIKALRYSVNSLMIKQFKIGDNLPNSSILKRIQESIDQSAIEIIDTLDDLTLKLKGSSEHEPDWSIHIKEWEQQYALHIEKYQAAIEQNFQHQEQLKILDEMENKIKEKQSVISEYEKQLIDLNNPKKKLDINIKKLTKLYNDQRELLADQCSKLSTLSGGLIQAELAPGGDSNEHLVILTKVVQGSHINQEKILQLIDEINQSNNPFETWQRIVFEIQTIWEHYLEQGPNFEIPSEVQLITKYLKEREIRRLAERINEEKIISLLLYRFKEKPIFKYCIPGGETIDFNQASAGQQASALLKVLLLNEGPPLIIDQPEDDLDNEIVAEIAELIWEAKKKRQLIFASHNANLVVNGDAELVVHFGYKHEGDQSMGVIKNVGSIDVPEIKKAITTVMEGGDLAFKLRQEKYGF